MTDRRFTQLDVFTSVPLRGKPLAVVHDAQGLSDPQMADMARWTNLLATSFLLPPHDPEADDRVCIFTPRGALPFAGHPTLGRAGRVFVQRDGADVWIGGDVCPVVSGQVRL